MAEPARVGDLQIHQDLPQERLEWKIERIGWVAMTLALLAALAGLTGPGPLSRATAEAEGALLRLQYNRFARHQAPESLRVHVGPGTAQDGKLRLWLSSEYVHNLESFHIDPEPESVEAGPDRYTYHFRLSDAARPTIVVFRFEPDQMGRLHASIGLDGGPQLAFTQFVYP